MHGALDSVVDLMNEWDINYNVLFPETLYYLWSIIYIVITEYGRLATFTNSPQIYKLAPS